MVARWQCQRWCQGCWGMSDLGRHLSQPGSEPCCSPAPAAVLGDDGAVSPGPAHPAAPTLGRNSKATASCFPALCPVSSANPLCAGFRDTLGAASPWVSPSHPQILLLKGSSGCSASPQA